MESYFHPTTDRNGIMEADFRGRKLSGIVVDLPDNCKGAIVCPSKSNSTEVAGVFNRIHVWEHDTTPSSDVLEESLGWIEIADAVHSS